MYSIGEFSKMTGLTVKTLRFYHEQKLLEPRHVEAASGYRYYDDEQVETARAIALLRSLEFSLSDIKELFAAQRAGETIVALLERQKNELGRQIKQFRTAMRTIDRFIADEKGQAAAVDDAINEQSLPPINIAAIRMRGRYSDCGRAFGKLGRAFGRHIAGKPFLLHYDSEYKEDDADFEVCMPVRSSKAVDGVSVRELPGGHAVALMHHGPYDEMGRSYARVFKYIKQHRYEVAMPTREIYLKGPGMIFAGNPRNYLTEIQIPVTRPS